MSFIFNLSHSYNCLGGWAICISRISQFFFFAKLQLKKFWAWTVTETGLCLGRMKAKVFDEFQTFWILNMFTCSNSIPTGIMGLNMKIWTCWRSRMLETCQMGKVVQHREHISNPLQVFKHKLKHLYQINRSDDNSALVLSTNLPFAQKNLQNELGMKKYVFFLLFPTSIPFFVTQSHKPAILSFCSTWFYQNYHQKAPSIPKHIFKVWKPNRKLILYYGKVKETYFTSVKKAKIL